MTSSVNEISRQVQESSRIAGEAVQAGAADRRAHQRAVAGGRPHRRRGEADHRDRRADQPAGAQRHHRGGARRRGRPRLCGGRLGGEAARLADREGDRRDRHADRRHADRDRRSRSRRSRRSAAPSAASRRSPRRSRRRWRSRAPPPRRSPATSARPPRAPRRSPPTSPTSIAARARPARPRRRCCPRRSRCRARATPQVRGRQVPHDGAGGVAAVFWRPSGRMGGRSWRLGDPRWPRGGRDRNLLGPDIFAGQPRDNLGGALSAVAAKVLPHIEAAGTCRKYRHSRESISRKQGGRSGAAADGNGSCRLRRLRYWHGCSEAAKSSGIDVTIGDVAAGGRISCRLAGSTGPLSSTDQNPAAKATAWGARSWLGNQGGT